ncbi:MAG TPA: branched-chain-amino-acid transaminase [Vicinamibacterales bacterium]|jgi:branched-chain amino acid aminotransferase
MDGIVYANGTWGPAHDARVSVFDHGLLYGDGIFEGIRAYNGRVFKLERHIDRLFESARAIRLEIGMAPDQVAALVLETCRQNAIVDGYIRLVVTRGAGDLGIDPRSCARAALFVIARQVDALYRRSPNRGISLATSPFRRVAPDALSPEIKSLNYLNNVLAKIDASDRGADEALFLGHDGHVAEATADNIFIVTARGIATPPTTQTLKGITRETVIEIAATERLTVDERPLSLVDVWTAREVFLCGTMAEVVPVGSIDGRVIGSGAPGEITMRIMTKYASLVRESGTPIPSVALEAVEAV